MCFNRVKEVKTRESQGDGRRVVGHGVDGDPAVPEGDPGLVPARQHRGPLQRHEGRAARARAGTRASCTGTHTPTTIIKCSYFEHYLKSRILKKITEYENKIGTLL